MHNSDINIKAMNPRKNNNSLKINYEKLMEGNQPASTQTIDISNGEIASLTVPESAANAIAVLEFTDSKMSLVGTFGGKYTTNGSDPQLTGFLIDENTGITLGEYIPVILDTVEKMENFKIIANELGVKFKAVLKVNYFA